MKNTNYILPLAAFAAGALLAKSGSNKVNGIGAFKGKEKTLNALAKAEGILWSAGSGYLNNEDKDAVGMARVALIDVVERNGYKINYDTHKIYMP